jgi:hypothetical protein
LAANCKAENFLPESNPGYWARFPSSVPTELRTHDKNLIRNVFKLNFGKVSPTNQINERKVLRCNALRASWLHSRGAGGAMLLTEGFLGWGVWADGWAEGWVGGVMGLRVGFININDMYNNDVGKGVVYAYEAYEVK